MSDQKPIDFTVKDLAERLALCTGDTPTFHARQVRHWAANGIMDAIGPWTFRGEGKTAARVYTPRHLAACIILHHYASQRADIDFLKSVCNVMRNDQFDHDDERIYTKGDGVTFRTVSWAGDGLATAIRFAREIAKTEGGRTTDWLIYLSLSLDRDGALKGGAFSTGEKSHGLIDSISPERRTLNVSLLLPCMFRDADGELNELATAKFVHSGHAYESDGTYSEEDTRYETD